ncbi:MAG: hypothetical protein CMM60_11570 [Rhodospirillaceae bacterium]|jgi:hypothetical protein|nr:hypothetical protein [Rhodospirillaceae bacterium]
MPRRRRSSLRQAYRAFEVTGAILDEVGLPSSPERQSRVRDGRVVDVPVTSKRRWLDRLWPFRNPEPHWRDYEQAAGAFLTGLGIAGVRIAGAGADGGVDVRVVGKLVGQVKALESKVGRPQLQQIYGIARAEGVQPLFFSRSGYSKAATEWANSVEMPLFEVSHGAEGFVVDWVNGPAKRFVTANV